MSHDDEGRERQLDLARKWGMPYVALDCFVPEAKAVLRIPFSLADEHDLIAVKEQQSVNVLWVAVHDFPHPSVMDAVHQAAGCTLKLVFSCREDIRRAIAASYPECREG
jgi:hypothetical protein